MDLSGLMKQKETKEKDRLLLLAGSTAEMWPIMEVTEEFVNTGRQSWPRRDLALYHLPEGGRLYVVAATLPAIIEAERVRALQEDAALRAVFAPSAGEGPGQPWMLYILVALSIVGLIFKH